VEEEEVCGRGMSPQELKEGSVDKGEPPMAEPAYDRPHSYTRHHAVSTAIYPSPQFGCRVRRGGGGRR